jgi:hypothetical protein
MYCNLLEKREQSFSMNKEKDWYWQIHRKTKKELE